MAAEEAEEVLDSRGACAGTGAASGDEILILEVHAEFSSRALRALCQNVWDWRKTLAFRCGPVHFFVFHYAGRRVRFLGNRLLGVKLHWNGSPVLLPPSWFVFGPPVTYVSDPETAVLEAPAWLLD